MYAEDNADKLRGIGRQLRAAANAPTLDPEDLEWTFGRLQEELDAARLLAVANLRRQGHSWSAIGRGLGMSRQAAHKAFWRADDTAVSV